MMSYQAVEWVLDSAPTRDPYEMLVLLAIAERALPDGRESYYSIRQIAKRTRLTVAGAHGVVARLLGRGVLTSRPLKKARAYSLPLFNRVEQSSTSTVPPAVQPGVQHRSTPLNATVQPGRTDPSGSFHEPSEDQDHRPLAGARKRKAPKPTDLDEVRHHVQAATHRLVEDNEADYRDPRTGAWLVGSLVEEIKPVAARLGVQWTNSSGLTGIVEGVLGQIDEQRKSASRARNRRAAHI